MSDKREERKTGQRFVVELIKNIRERLTTDQFLELVIQVRARPLDWKINAQP